MKTASGSTSHLSHALLALALLAWGLGAPRLAAATVEFGTSGAWNVGSDWVGGAAPGTADTADIAHTLMATVGSGVTATVTNTYVGTTNGSGQLTVLGGAFTATGLFYVGYGGAAAVYLGSGSIASSSIDFSYNGAATVTVTGGTLTSTASNLRIGMSSFSAGGLTTFTQTGGTVSSASGILFGGTSSTGPATASTYSISAGTLSWATTMTMAAGTTLTITGEAPTVTGTWSTGTNTNDGFKIVAAAGQPNAVIKFVCGPAGVSPISIPNSYLNLGTTATLAVDGGAYIDPGEEYITLFTFKGYDSGVTQHFNTVNITGFPWHNAALIYNPGSIVLHLVPKTRPIVGAERWDAWTGGTNAVYAAVQADLSPTNWHYRLPFFGTVTSSNTVTIDGSSQAVMDQEIAYAARAGLSYWAFCTYLPASYASSDPKVRDIAIPLGKYLTSANRGAINFCIILGADSWPQNDFKAYAESLIEQPGYQTVLGGRPLLYLLDADTHTITNNWGGNTTNLVNWLNGIRSDVQAAGKGNPYIVVMDPDAADGATWCAALGCDAIGAYSSTGNSNGHAGGLSGATYPSLVSGVEWFWGNALASGKQFIPLIKAGSDNRPRVQTPPWFEPNAGAMDYFWQAATPAQLQSHVNDALQWNSTNSTNNVAQASLIYAWNEFDEGGYICPTLTGGTALLDAVSSAIQSWSY